MTFHLPMCRRTSYGRLMLNVPGAQLFVTELGDGPNLVLMLHGGPAAGHDYLRPGLDALAQPGVRRLFYYDQRGCGRSTLDAGVPLPGWQTHVADIEAIREQLGQIGRASCRERVLVAV